MSSLTKQPLVSVIIPCYNAALYIRDALLSITQQTYTHLEIIVIDDGSTDDSPMVVEALAAGDKRIKLFRNERNQRLVKTLNRGISLSKGKYIARMDADDIAMKHRIEKQVAFMESHPEIGIAGTFTYDFNAQGFVGINKRPVEHESIKAYLFTGSPFFHPTVIIRKEVLDRYALRYDDNYYRAEDHALWVHLLSVTQGANLPEALLKYRLLPNSETRLGQADQINRIETLINIHKLVLAKIQLKLSSGDQSIYSCAMARWALPLLEEGSMTDLKRVFNIVLNHVRRTAFVKEKPLRNYLALRFIVFFYFSGSYRNPRQLFKTALTHYFYRGLLVHFRNMINVAKQ